MTPKTVKHLNGYKGAKAGLYAGAFLAPVVPASITTIINWQEWFAKSGTSLPLGFASLLVTVIVAILGVVKSDTVLKKADIALYYLAMMFCCIGITCMFLSSLFSSMGYMWLETGAGLVASGVCVTVENKVIEPKIAFYKELVEKNCLDIKSKRRKAREELARKEAEEEASLQAFE